MRPSRVPRAAVVLLFVCVASLLILIPSDADAQRRAGRGIRVVPGRVVVMRAYYAPLFHDPWFSPYGPYGAYPPYYGPAYGYAPAAALRIQAQPRETEVFIDGYYAGSVDDFDGFFQRMQLEPGEHEVTLYLAGHRTTRQNIYLQPGRTFRLRHTMEPLPAGSPAEARPTASSAPRPPYPGPGAPGRGEGPPPPPRGFEGQPPNDASLRQVDAGTIAIRVQPAGATILIDGEEWEGPDDTEQLVVQVAPGPHRIEVRREGYRSYSADLDVRAGQTSPLNVSLSRQ